MNELKIKRVYENPAKNDGIRILVDRLYPRGIKKEQLHYDFWLKDAASSTELRKWFSHDPSKFSEFKKEYKKELKSNKEVQHIKNLLKENNVTLIYAAKDEKINHAIVLKDFILNN